jgi:chemotaxis protein methyltransferase CheR
MTSEQFDRTRRLARRLAGIELHERHRELLHRRCRRIEILSPASLDALLSAAEDGDPAAGRQFVGLVTTKFTGFFRNPSHFEVAVRHAVEAARRRSAARLWSAAAATGEEPYSLAMALIEGFQREDPPVTVLATDISDEALAVARLGEFGEAALDALTPEQRARFFGESAGATRWRLAPEVRRLVEFRVLNLVDPVWPIEEPFDVIFCRNVLMYLEAGHRCAALERMASLLAPDGLLMLDPTEHLGKAERLFAAGAGGVYSLRRTSGSADVRNSSPLRTKL